jgi:uncharacterized membrane protein YeaQ/YmgE (transglycosylase-associated protein family)
MRMHLGIGDLLTVLIVGAIVGWLAGVLMKTHRQMGILADIVVGVIGSAIGHWLFAELGLYAYGLVGSLIVSTIGAVLLIAILKGLKIYR